MDVCGHVGVTATPTDDEEFVMVSPDEVPSPEDAEELFGGSKEEVDGSSDDAVSGCH